MFGWHHEGLKIKRIMVTLRRKSYVIIFYCNYTCIIYKSTWGLKYYAIIYLLNGVSLNPINANGTPKGSLTMEFRL